MPLADVVEACVVVAVAFQEVPERFIKVIFLAHEVGGSSTPPLEGTLEHSEGSRFNLFAHDDAAALPVAAPDQCCCEPGRHLGWNDELHVD